MPLVYEDLRVLQLAESLADSVWKLVVAWQPFARDAMGKQVIQASDSIGANISEAFGRYHYADKLVFLYDARGSLFETKYWLNRAFARKLIDEKAIQAYVAELDAASNLFTSADLAWIENLDLTSNPNS